LPVAAQRPTRGLQQAPLPGNPPTIPAVPDDYPLPALRAAEGATVGLRFRVGADGDLDEVQLAQSSGVRRLDEAAERMLETRWRASPATLAGMPVEVWRTASVTFRPVANPMPPPRCYARPIIGEDAVLLSVRQVNPQQSNNPAPDEAVAERWIEVQPDGTITDALLSTARGWMHLSRPLTEALPPYPSPEQRVCWFNDPIPLVRR
jgi:protein TonB